MRIVIWVCVIALLLLALGGGVYWFLTKNAAVVSTNTPVSSDATSQVKVTDYGAGTPNKQKTAVLVQHSDSSREKFLLPNNLVANFVTSLPAGDKVISTTPLQ